MLASNLSLKFIGEHYTCELPYKSLWESKCFLHIFMAITHPCTHPYVLQGDIYIFGTPDNQHQHQDCEQDIMIMYDI